VKDTDAERLRAEWKAKGMPPCAHETLSIEVSVSGYMTGYYVCTSCGHRVKTTPLGSSER
jgi:hypothetical protein